MKRVITTKGATKFIKGMQFIWSPWSTGPFCQRGERRGLRYVISLSWSDVNDPISQTGQLVTLLLHLCQIDRNSSFPAFSLFFLSLSPLIFLPPAAPPAIALLCRGGTQSNFHTSTLPHPVTLPPLKQSGNLSNKHHRSWGPQILSHTSTLNNPEDQPSKAKEDLKETE